MKHFFERLIENPALKIIISTLGTLITFLLGGFDLALNSFAALLFLDLVTGLTKASKQNRISSYIGRMGKEKLIGYFVTIMLATLLQQAGLPGIRTYVIFWAAVMETISFFENCDELDWWVPEVIRKRLLQTKEKKFGDLV